MGTWQDHYRRNRSQLSWPDENLVRMLSRALEEGKGWEDPTALDLGCGSGRHLSLLKQFGFPLVIGMDNSARALEISRSFEAPLFQGDNRRLPLADASCNLIVAWGSLHYAPKEDLTEMLREIHRVLIPGGLLLGTLRSDRDSYMKKGEHLGNNVWLTGLKDIEGTIASFFSEKEVKEYFAPFARLDYGIAERSPVGKRSEIISHWLVYAGK